MIEPGSKRGLKRSRSGSAFSPFASSGVGGAVVAGPVSPALAAKRLSAMGCPVPSTSSASEVSSAPQLLLDEPEPRNGSNVPAASQALLHSTLCLLARLPPAAAAALTARLCTGLGQATPAAAPAPRAE